MVMESASPNSRLNRATISASGGTADPDLPAAATGLPGTVPACLAATIIHCREESREHECGEVDLESLDAWWKRAEAHGFRLAHRPVAGPAA